MSPAISPIVNVAKMKPALLTAASPRSYRSYGEKSDRGNQTTILPFEIFTRKKIC